MTAVGADSVILEPPAIEKPVEKTVPRYGTKILTRTDEFESVSSWWKARQYRRESDYDYFTTYLLTRPNLIGPHMVVATRDGEPSAMMAAYITSAPLPVYIGFIRFGQFSLRTLIIPYGGFVGDIDHDTMSVFLSEIKKLLSNGSIDMVHAAFIERDSLVERELRRSRMWMFRGYQPEITHQFIDLADTVEGMYEQIQAKKRKWLYQMRALERDYGGEVTFEVFTKLEDVDRLLALAGAVSSKTWKAGSGVDIITSRHRNQYLLWAAQTGRMRGYVLSVKNSPVSFWIGSRFGTTFYLDYCDFDTEYRKYSMGHLTLIKLYEDLIRSTDIRTVDFQADNIAYKKRYGNRSILERHVRLFAPTLRGLVLNLVDSGTTFTTAMGGKVLEKGDIKTKLKRWRKDRQAGQARKKIQ